MTPAEAWEVLAEGNRRFVAGEPSHPNQNAERRSDLTAGQAPVAVIFGCADSRLAAEIIFDLGLGDVFVVRTAGHVIDDAVLGSIEYGVDVLEIPLVIVLGHNSCGAVTATVESYISGTMPRGFVRPLVERIIPSVLAGRRRGLEEVDEFVAEHVDQTCDHLLETSQSVRAAVESGRTAVVGLTYSLSEGTARPGRVHGDLAV
ncbi:carbonic anhydrase [Micrococcus luteus]|uniref:carbonic anhydrase n=1 Tax=unclassified Micrococcus TaxID=2620948 RepID=UPI00056D9A58|nr:MULTISPECIES: carbonic anhydrase [unclassified Micrococcus]MBN6767640.1 carbonic anhydrase [Micrococcus luteus]MBN6828557.1 carbonic anhydrase [Micrococcus luteus]MBN6846723.1 carbonic anhydrase [Micrococcus luteus]MBN6862877.1 carbonic anhydrase [Micrococcus luteus]MBN6864417.1 carbonic anhydrase [Micrococcus luteus]